MRRWREVMFQGAPRFAPLRVVSGAGLSTTHDVLDAARGEVIWIKEIPRGEGLRPGLIVHEYETLRLLGGTGPHVLQVHELFAGESAMAFSSERLVGTALDLHAGAGALDLTRAQRLFAQLVAAIDAVHRSGFVHADLKPPHVFVTAEGRLVLLGFELAMPTCPTAERRSSIAGTPIYMAPEVIRGEPTTKAADWYAVGTMLFEALTGQLPFEASSMRGLIRHKAESPAPSAGAIVKGVPEELNQLCMALLDRDPLERPNAEAILRVLAPSRTPHDGAREGGS